MLKFMSALCVTFIFLFSLPIHAQNSTDPISNEDRDQDATNPTIDPEQCPIQSEKSAERESFSDGMKVERFIKPPKLRPCCMLGYGLRTKITDTAVPVKLDNMLYPDRLGWHSYEKRSTDTEQNGLIYTCMGGVVDIAHVRDYADYSAYLYERIRIVLGSGALIPIAPEAGERSILIKPIEAKLSEKDREELSLLLAERISFQLSVWHEIATWYDHRSVAMFSERASSFSPEDLFSNLLGAKIGAEALRRGGDYNHSIDEILARRIYDLVPLAKGHGKRMLDAVDGIWWDSTKMIPEMRLVARRNIQVGDSIYPWRVSDSHSIYCSNRNEEAKVLDVPTEGPQGLKLRDLYELRFHVDREEVPKFILPDNGKQWVGEDDFPWIIENIRQGVLKEFGPYGDQSGMDIYDLGAQEKFSNVFDPERPCGRSDPDCSLTRNDEVHGIKIGKIQLAGGNMPGFMLGATLAEGSTPGGLFNVLRFNSILTFNEFSYIMHVKAVESPALMFCAIEAEDGSGRTNIDYPFVNPFDTKCVPGSYWGIKLDMLEMLYDSQTNSYGFRPLEFGVVLNAFGNGHTMEFLQRRLLFSIGMAPEIINVSNDDKGKQSDIAAYFSVIYDRYLLNNRIYWKSFGSIRDLVSDYESFNAEAGARLQYNHLWNRRDFRGGDPLHSMVNIGAEVAVNYWFKNKPSMPSMLKYLMIPNDKDYIPDDWHFNGHVILYIETTIPKLGIF